MGQTASADMPRRLTREQWIEYFDRFPGLQHDEDGDAVIMTRSLRWPEGDLVPKDKVKEVPVVVVAMDPLDELFAAEEAAIAELDTAKEVLGTTLGFPNPEPRALALKAVKDALYIQVRWWVRGCG